MAAATSAALRRAAELVGGGDDEHADYVGRRWPTKPAPGPRHLQPGPGVVLLRRRRRAGGQAGRRRAGVEPRAAGARHRAPRGWRPPATDADVEAAKEGVIEAEGFKFRSLAIDPAAYQMAYDVVSNATLWFLHHGLFDLSRRPRLDRRWREAWDAYRDVNHTFAQAVIDEAPEGAIVLVQDYHLALVGTWLAQERRDLRAVHFSHIPFCEPGALRVLPSDVAEELLVGMGSHASCGFHSRRWAANFEACCDEVLGFTPATFVSPLSPHYDDIAAMAARGRLRPGAGVGRRGQGRPPADRAGRPHRAVEEPAAGLLGLRRPAAHPDRVAGPGGLPRPASTRRGRGCPSTWPTARRWSRWPG